jgi:3-hydroxybutyryl-CoA dehydratase
MSIRAGDRASHRFVVDAESMRRFQALSHDNARIHTDEAYAQARGYKGVIAYQGILAAQLSHVVGTKLPGTNGTSIKWAIEYSEPLYVGDAAELDFEIGYVSKATGIVVGKFQITSGDRMIATGSTQSIVPVEEIVE